MRRTLERVVVALVTAGICGACTRADPTPPTPAPTRGPDSSYGGQYQGVGTMIESGPTAADGGTGVDTARVASWTLSVTDDSKDHLVLQIGTACSLPATVTTRRYDTSGGTGHLPLTMATASVTSKPSCEVEVAGATVSILVDTGEARLYADDSLSIVVAGTASSGGEIYAEFTFDGRRGAGP